MNRKDFFKFIFFSLLTFSVKLRASSTDLVKKLAHVVKVEVSNNKVILYFSKKVEKSDIKSLEINDRKRNKYKKIFDIKSLLYTKARVVKKSVVDEVRFAQFQRDTTRLVLANNSEIHTTYNIKGNTLEINMHSSNNTIKAKIQPQKRRTVVIDAGHGGKDSGATYKEPKGRKKEKDTVFKVALYLESELKKRGYRVYLTRKKDKFVDLKGRTKLANKKKADIFISIHANATSKKSNYSKLQGIETYFLSPARSKKAKRIASIENQQTLEDVDTLSQNIFLNILNREKIKASNRLAIDIQEKMLLSLRKKANYSNVKDGGVREAPFWVLIGAQMPSVLIETGYITNPRERLRLFNSHYQKYLAKGIANGIDGYFIKNRI